MSDGTVPDGGGREFERVAGVLRTRMTDGTFGLKSRLPPERELAEEFGVSRSTVQRVLRELRSEGWIETRQGSGSRVVRTQWIPSPTSSRSADRRASLGLLIGEAFEQPEVTLDVFTLTSESLDAHIRLQAERIRDQEIAPRRIALRMLLPSEDVWLPYWRADDPDDDQALRERLLDISRWHTASLRTVLDDLRTMKLVPSVDFEIRRVTVAPTYKLYLVNRTAALFGPYEAFERSIELADGRVVEAVDVRGLGARLTHHVKEDGANTRDTVFVEMMQSWFDSAWTLLTDGP
ncbi:GntR family transcriptional regulator [Streptomyces sp. SID5910]|uniref:GntR family transcriptional regulator n=1 Tax=Streptomyces sp. SID5910 TaxID=2690312 RepID=UPI0013683E7B|nr:GntR family transcriptional regulator [Streptomyces sp. SID5910]